MRFRYQLTGTGWSELSIETSEASVRITASHLSDALGDFIEATRSVLAGAIESRCSFAEEPGEYRWIFRRISSDLVHVSVRWFDELWGERSDDRGDVKFESTMSPTTLGRKVIQMVEDLRHAVGEAGYVQKWPEHPFPAEGVTRLPKVLEDQKAAQPGATDNPDDAQRLREDH